MHKYAAVMYRRSRFKMITGYKGFFFGMVFGFFLVVIILHTTQHPILYKNVSCYKTISPHITRLVAYDYTCGTKYWQSGKNFDNKDDIRFFPILSNILVPTRQKIIIIEFGANIGQYSEAVLGTPHKTPFSIHSIEPILKMFASLKNRSVKFKKRQDDEHFHYNIAISDRPGRLPIYSVDSMSEGAALGKGLQWNYTKTSDVAVTTLPDFIKKNLIKTPISFVKIDVEGFEPEVIIGMNLEANAHLFPLFSFETGGAWRDDRSSLAKNYTLKSFMIMLDSWGYDLFFIGNPYLLPISGENWSDLFDGFVRSPNVLSALRYSVPWKNLLKSFQNISFDSCRWH